MAYCVVVVGAALVVGMMIQEAEPEAPMAMLPVPSTAFSTVSVGGRMLKKFVAGLPEASCGLMVTSRSVMGEPELLFSCSVALNASRLMMHGLIDLQFDVNNCAGDWLH